LTTELAIRLFKDDHGRLPDSLDQLVPKYLASSPIDPYSADGASLIYRLSGDGYLLYSIGPDRRDDGGEFGVWAETSNSKRPLDIDVDTLIRQ
jgi:hypothetical protein